MKKPLSEVIEIESFELDLALAFTEALEMVESVLDELDPTQNNYAVGNWILTFVSVNAQKLRWRDTSVTYCYRFNLELKR